MAKVQNIEKYLSEIGIKEHLPPSNKRSGFSSFNYAYLDFDSIRLFNKINEFIDQKEIDSVEDMIGEANIEIYEVVSSTKTSKLQIIHNSKLAKVLVDKEVFPPGQDLPERF